MKSSAFFRFVKVLAVCRHHRAATAAAHTLIFFLDLQKHKTFRVWLAVALQAELFFISACVNAVSDAPPRGCI